VPTEAAFDFAPIEVLTFDCYGTLIDWEAGILAALRRILGPQPHDDALLESYAQAETQAEAGPWQSYRDILQASLAAVCAERGIRPTAQQSADFASSVADWPAFPDSAAALDRLRGRFRLGVITNCDDDLFAASDRRFGEPFEWVITAEQVRAYKPSARNFEVALERIGRPRAALLHVAQSLFHDHVPAQALGLATAWIDRRHDRPGFGATPPASATANLSAPDMATFADMALSA
jgi:2-haloacid dehalogenase